MSQVSEKAVSFEPEEKGKKRMENKRICNVTCLASYCGCYYTYIAGRKI